MKITKYIHSCVLVEENDARILFDPGSYLTNDMIAEIKRQEPQAIFITHKHQDHFVPDILKELIGSETKLYIPSDAMQTIPEGVNANLAVAGTMIQVGTNTITVVAKEHGDLPVPKPENVAYLVNGRVLDPGDSVRGEEKNVEVLLLPLFAPWSSVTKGIEYAMRVKPKIVVPIHDAFVKESFLTGIYEHMCKPVLEKEGIEFTVLAPGTPVEI